MALTSLSSAVLAGGKGTRMGGQDKGLLLFQNEPMVMPIARALKSASGSVFVNANRHVEEYLALGFEVVSDHQDYSEKGPLSGLLTCLMRADSSHLLVSPCDTPRITESAFMALIEACHISPDKIHYLAGESGNHPLHAILPVQSAIENLKGFFDEAGRYSVMVFYEMFGCKSVFWNKESDFLNVNTPDSLL
ncbi:molybdenum cofactor guanylyltransferase [Marinomonas sp. 5E14-1]|uniref:molybdenum cofactor guanylyltransferase n=1 Tax=Marinomonas sp. 5E14-1 TaxID=3153922 RepID=UPI00326446B9